MVMLNFPACAALAIVGWAAESHAAWPFGVRLTPIGTHTNGPPHNTSVAEIVVHEPVTQRLDVVNAQGKRIDVLDVQDPTVPTKIATRDLSPMYSLPHAVIYVYRARFAV